MSHLWTPRLRRDFHEAVEKLHDVTKTPSEETSYNLTLSESDSQTYTLRLRDELQLADHVAFLAHSQEGVEAISGVCVEEVDAGLAIRLASNRTPCQETVSGLRKILSTLSHGAAQGGFLIRAD